MLRRLEVRDLAILEAVAVEFGPGLNVLSGETGAGKSLLLDALQLALGARADPGLIRQGARGLAVSTLFELPAQAPALDRLAALGLEAEDGTVLLTREVLRDGRGVCRVNGQLTTATVLREVGSLLLSLAGQGEHHRFGNPARQLAYLDAYGGDAVAAVRSRYAAAHAAWQGARTELAALGGDGQARALRREALGLVVAEIDAVAPRADEEDTLAARRAVLAHAQRLAGAADAALTLLWEGEAAVRDRLGLALREVDAAAAVDAALTEVRELLAGAGIAVDEAARALRRYRDALDFDPASAAALEDRWTVLSRCKRKYGATLADVLACREAAAREGAELDAADAAAQALTGQIAVLAREAAALALELGQARAAAAARLEQDVAAALSELGMPGARLEIALQTRPDPDGLPCAGALLACDERGLEAATFLWAANAGEPAQPLGKVASGGELARLLLCLHALRAEGIDVPSLVFDEVDAGIGGRAAASVAERLHRLGESRQVLCVTHLAVIAASADGHHAIEKRITDGRTQTVIRPLAGEARTAEIARMLDGGRGPASAEHARELLRRSARQSSAGGGFG